MVLITGRKCDECGEATLDCVQVRLERTGYTISIGSAESQHIAQTDLCISCFNQLSNLIKMERAE